MYVRMCVSVHLDEYAITCLQTYTSGFPNFDTNTHTHTCIHACTSNNRMYQVYQRLVLRTSGLRRCQRLGKQRSNIWNTMTITVYLSFCRMPMAVQVCVHIPRRNMLRIFTTQISCIFPDSASAEFLLSGSLTEASARTLPRTSNGGLPRCDSYHFHLRLPS